MRRVIVSIARKGGVRLEASGFKADECLTATREIEHTLGGAVVRSTVDSSERVVDQTESSTVVQQIRLEY